PHAFQPPSPPVDVFTTQQEHVLRTGVSHVAIRDGTITGFASAWSRGDDWFLASLFIAPDAQGQGLGRRLLDAVWGGEFARRRTITDAIQPISNALYAGRGLAPTTRPPPRPPSRASSRRPTGRCCCACQARRGRSWRRPSAPA